MTSGNRLRGQVLEDLPDVKRGRLPGKNACHPGMGIVPETAPLPDGEQSVESRVKIDKVTFFGVDMLVKAQPGQLFIAWSVRASVNFNGGMQREKPFGERLADFANLLKTLWAGSTPGFQEIEPFVRHDRFQILQQGRHVVI